MFYVIYTQRSIKELMCLYKKAVEHSQGNATWLFVSIFICKLKMFLFKVLYYYTHIENVWLIHGDHVNTACCLQLIHSRKKCKDGLLYKLKLLFISFNMRSPLRIKWSSMQIEILVPALICWWNNRQLFAIYFDLHFDFFFMYIYQ